MVGCQDVTQKMSNYSLCVITPTISRPTLYQAITSAIVDEWLVIGDGPQLEAERIVNEVEGIDYIEGPQTGDYGNAQRDLGIAQAQADYLSFLDDDDVFMPGAVETIKSQLDGSPIIFRMLHPTGAVLWQRPGLSVGNVGGSMFIVPNVKSKLGKWANGKGYMSDFDFIETTLKHWGQPKWAGDVIIRCQPTP